MSIIKSFFFYFVNPTREIGTPETVKQRLTQLLVLVLFDFFVFLCYKVVLVYLIYVHICPSLIPVKQVYNNFIYLFFVPILWAPVFEETMFRLWILYSWGKLAVSLAVCVFYIGMSVSGVHLFDRQPHAVIVYIFLLSAFVGLGVYSLAKKINNKKLNGVWIRQQRKFLVVGAIVFGYAHMRNYVIDKEMIIWSPVLFLPLIWHGLVFGYIRVRFGFVYAIVAHSCINLIFGLFSII